MKKTLIALLAIAPFAYGMTGAELNTALQEKFVGYTYGDAFSITTQMASINNLNKGFVTLGTSNGELGSAYYIVNQQHQYWGLNTADSNNLSGNNKWTLAVDGNTYTYTSTQDQLPVLWTQNATGTGSATRSVGNHIGVAISSDGTNSTITLSYTGTQIVDTFVLQGIALNANEISVMDNIGDVQSWSASYTHTPDPVPEPATGTLSLLALAGLCARRRRK